jgi:hypothetical protein
MILNNICDNECQIAVVRCDSGSLLDTFDGCSLGLTVLAAE